MLGTFVEASISTEQRRSLVGVERSSERESEWDVGILEVVTE